MIPDGATPTAIAVTGGAGALGLHFIRRVLGQTSLPVRVLLHRKPLPTDLQTSRVVQVQGSLLDSASLNDWLCPGAAVVHLAWSASMSAEEHRRSIAALADAGVKHGIVRFVHCSTAVVAGRTRADVVDEDTPCEPVTPYERSKYEIELAITETAAGRFPLRILRPTAVFGPGLQNLVSLMDALQTRPRLINHARAAVFGRRRLHLVPVETVAEAILFLARARERGVDDDVVRYIVSADDEPGGDFRSIEARLRCGLGLGHPFKALSVPPFVLRFLLAAIRRSDTNPNRIYDASRLRRAGFVAPVTLAAALDNYVAWYRLFLQQHRSR